MKNKAEIVERCLIDEVDVGSTVTIQDVASAEERTFVVGGYQILDQQHDNEISYATPLAKPVIGATVGEERKVEIGGNEAVSRVVRIG